MGRAGNIFLKVLGRAALGSIAVGCMFACASNDEQQQPPTVLAMTETLTPEYDDGEVMIYEVQAPVTLPIMRPTDAQKAALGKMAPYPRAPFYRSSDVSISITYTISSLEPTNKIIVELLLDPWNEFVRYKPGVQIDDEQTDPNLSGIDRYIVLEPLQRVTGIITPDDMQELAVDLGTAEALFANPPGADSGFAGPTLYNRAFNVQNLSTQPDPLLAPYIPAVAPGITGFDLGLRMTSDDDDDVTAPANVAVEISVNITDITGGHVIDPSDTTDKPMGPPGTVLTPPAPPVMTD